MLQKQLRPAPLVTAETDLGIAKLASFSSKYPTFWTLSQEKPDTVMLIAARCGVDPASVRHQLSAFGIEVPA